MLSAARLAAVSAEEVGSAGEWLAPDWVAIGLVLSVLGVFLLGNAILFRHPRMLIEEFFGRRASGPSGRLHAIREHVFHRAQVAVGFSYLVGGFGLQLLGRYRRDAGSDAAGAAGGPAFPAGWVGMILVATIALLALAWWWARHSFRRHVREHLRREAPDFEADLALAREVGELFGVESQSDDTVQSYLDRLHRALDLPPPEKRGRREVLLSRLEAMDVEEEA